MNIFACYRMPVFAARALDDARLRKMLLETAQILCTVASKHGVPAPYKPYAPSHPAVLWTEAERNHARWLWGYFNCLCTEYRHRFDRVHASERAIRAGLSRHALLAALPQKRYGWPRTWPNGSPEANRDLLRKKWREDKREPTWTRREPPTWR